MDQLMICLPSDARAALEKASFIRRYEILPSTFNGERTSLDERLCHVDDEIVLDSFVQSGYRTRFESKEEYFWIEGIQIETYMFSGDVILDDGLAGAVQIVEEDGDLTLGLPIGEYSRLMIVPDYKIKRPIFETHEDLDEIVEPVSKLLEDFKKVMTTP